jgi:arylsulfatase A-like enzyme
MDIFATSSAIAGATTPQQVEGVNLLPYLNGKNTSRPHETLFWRQGGKTALRHGDWKLVRMGRKLNRGQAQWELYDLSKDISETTNLAETNPERVSELLTIWTKMNSDMSEPLF